MTSPGFTLRDAAPGDCADIACLVHDLATFEKLAHEAVATAADFRAELFGGTPAAFAMVADTADGVAGIAVWHFNFSTFKCRRGLYVEDIYVRPEHRGQGIGRAFFAELARRALQAGCARMEWSVLDWNENAVRFYRSMGATGMEDWTVQRLTAEKIAVLAGEMKNG